MRVGDEENDLKLLATANRMELTMGFQLISVVCAVLLLCIIAALIFSPSFRKDLLGSEGDASVFGFVTVKGAAIVLLSALFLGGMAYPLSLQGAPGKIIGQHGKLIDGEICDSNDECLSHCFPGPSPTIVENPIKYCIARDHQCALPKLSGAKLGTVVYLGGNLLKCGQPKNGGPARFTSPANLE